MPHVHIGDVLVDATISENPSFTNTVTDKPVEEGGSISDHVENEPTVLPLECTITGEEGTSADEKYERLQEIAQEKEIIEVVGALQMYENMVIEEFAPVKDADIANGFRADITLKQVRIVEQDTIEVVLGADPATGNQSQGDEEELESRDTESDDLDEDTLSSILYGLTNGGDESEGDE